MAIRNPVPQKRNARTAFLLDEGGYKLVFINTTIPCFLEGMITYPISEPALIQKFSFITSILFMQSLP